MTIVAIARYQLWPARVQAWLVAWQEIARAARKIPACRHMRLLVDPNDGTHRAVLSEWDNRQEFDRFWRERGVHWVEDALEYERIPAEIFVFSVVPPEDGKAVVDDLYSAKQMFV